MLSSQLQRRRVKTFSDSKKKPKNFACEKHSSPTTITPLKSQGSTIFPGGNLATEHLPVGERGDARLLCDGEQVEHGVGAEGSQPMPPF